MKQTFFLVGIILTGILIMAYIFSLSPDLINYKIDDKYDYIYTKPPFPDIELYIETTTMDIWGKVKHLNEKDTTTSVTENDTETPPQESVTENEAAVTTVPDEFIKKGAEITRP